MEIPGGESPQLEGLSAESTTLEVSAYIRRMVLPEGFDRQIALDGFHQMSGRVLVTMDDAELVWLLCGDRDPTEHPMLRQVVFYFRRLFKQSKYAYHVVCLFSLY